MRFSPSAAAMLLVLASADPTVAQQRLVDAAVTATGGVSVQPTDQSYVGGPYLDKALGGVGPTVSAGLNVRFPRVLTIAAEYSTGWLQDAQSGRIVGGERVPGRLRDSMASVLGGIYVRRGATTTQLLGGVSRLLTTPTSGGVAIEVASDEKLRRHVWTLGLDMATQLTSRVSLLISSRAYLNVDRGTSAQQIGIGRQIFRLGAGLRWRVGS